MNDELQVEDYSKDGKKKKRSLWGTLKKRVQRGVANAAKDKVNDTSKYVRILCTILDRCQLFGDYIQRIDHGRFDEKWGLPKYHAICTHLVEIATFCRNVVCAVVIRDMQKVLKRYIKHCSRAVADPAFDV